MKSNYKRLGDYISEVDVRNREEKVTRLLGVSIDKKFIESIANTIGTDMSVYKIVKRGQFAYGPVTSRNGDKVSIALLTEENCIISSSYTVFEITETKKLLPEYLNLWFKRPEFDRYARFHSHGSAREIFDWEEMCNVQLPVPSIEEQEKIVDAYQKIEDRIALKRKINENLEKQVTAMYHYIFDTQKTWKDGTIADLGEIVGGATPSKKKVEYFCDNGIVWLTPKDLTSTGLKFIYKGETDITQTAYDSCSTKMMPKGTVLLTSRAPVGSVAIAMVDLCTNQGFKSIVPKEKIGTAYVYYFLKENKQLLDSYSSGTTFMEISGNVLKEIHIKLPDKEAVSKFNAYCVPVFNYQIQNEKKIKSLQELKQLLISKLSNG